ncbi:unnamed protein product [Zymoseptoria tritici ST99CH_3D7]|uniref:Uncharacterized protein n=1 Tax=Zymoseptoria tritici (strain ST99CH_3D7) TaxID=1276538 RepID=A0A1X7RXQ0_ZYMT9|nr:unnamed protein product [Zymoseptoria tritici ST99CH_3D7]
MSDRTLVTVVLPGLADMMLVMPGTLSQTMQDADVSTFTLDAIDRVKNRGRSRTKIIFDNTARAPSDMECAICN